MNGLYCQPIKVPQHASSTAQHNQQPGGVFPRRDTQSTNWAPRDKYTTSTTSQQLPIILNSQWKFSWPEAAGGATSFSSDQISTTLSKAHPSHRSSQLSCVHLCLIPLLQAETHYCVLTQLIDKGERRCHFMELGLPPGPQSLPLPLYLLQGSPSIPRALPEITALSPLLWP